MTFDVAPEHAASSLANALMWGLPVELITTALLAADGQELGGKIFSPRSSSALAINAFGPFLGSAAHAALLPTLPGLGDEFWPAISVDIEARLRFPWRGGRRPNLDVLIQTKSALIGVESKRFEPFRGSQSAAWSETYFKHDWGPSMRRFLRVAQASRDGALGYQCLAAAQLVKHAFGLATTTLPNMEPILLYLYAEPRSAATLHEQHRREIADFAATVRGDRVQFHAATYQELLTGWRNHGTPQLRAHAAALTAFFEGDL